MSDSRCHGNTHTIYLARHDRTSREKDDATRWCAGIQQDIGKHTNSQTCTLQVRAFLELRQTLSVAFLANNHASLR